MSLPAIPKHQVNSDIIIENEEELNKTLSSIDEPTIVLRVYDTTSLEYCGYYILKQSESFALIGLLLSENSRLRHMKNGVKLSNSKLTIERNKLLNELDRIKSMSMFEFANTYCSSESLEEAGHMLAKDLLGR